jgi:hypothetical protein
MSTTPDRPNFFILLELDPDAPWSDDVFRRQLNLKRNKWSAQTNGVGQAKLDAKRNMDLIPDIEDVMGKAWLRDEEAKEAKRIQRDNEHQQQAKLVEILKVAEGKGYILEAEIETWKKNDLIPNLNDAQIRTKIRVPIVATPQPQKSTAPVGLDGVVSKEIQTQLTSLGNVAIDSLYTFLTVYAAEAGAGSVSDKSTCDELKTTASAVYRWSQDRRTLLGSKADTISNLASKVVTYLGDEAKRKLYDITIARSKIQNLLDFYAKVCKESGIINGQQADSFISDASKLGLSADEARAELTAMAAKEKLKILPSAGGPITQRCYVCDAPNDPSQQACSTCGMPLWVDCPNGDANHLPASIQYCPACDLEIGARFRIPQELESCNESILLKNWVLAERQLARTRSVWRVRRPDDFTRKMDELDAKIAPERERIEKMRKEQEEKERILIEAQANVIKGIEKAIAERHLYRARQLLGAMSPPPPNVSAYRNTITRGIDQAEDLVRQGRQARARGEIGEAARLYNLALTDACADSREAQDALRALPLAPPTHLRMRSSHEQSGGADSWRVELHWEPSSDAGADTIYYVSKSLTPPTPGNAGEPKGSRNETTWTDSQPQLGMTIYYSVVAEANGRRSDPVSGQILLAAPVADLECEIAPSEVHLRWKATSPHLRRVRIRRGENTAPGNITEGIEIAPQSLTSASDASVRTGALYGYSVFAQYVDTDGNAHWSEPATIRAVPQVAPPFITNLRAEQADGRLFYASAVLRCSTPPTGELTIMRYDSLEDVPRPRASHRWDRLTAHGKEVTERIPASQTTPSAATFTDTWAWPGRGWYVPVVHVTDMGYVGDLGTPAPFVCVRNVSEPATTMTDDMVRLGWTWPRDCTRVVVAYSPARWPSATGHVVSESFPCPRDEAGGRSSSVFQARHPKGAEAFFVVTAYARAGDTELVSAGYRYRAPIKPKPQLSMQQVQKRHAHWLELTLSHSLIAPALAVVSREDTLPTSATDGVVWYQQEGREWEKSVFKVPNSEKIPKGHFVGVFLTDAGERDAVEVITPPFMMQ